MKRDGRLSSASLRTMLEERFEDGDSALETLREWAEDDREKAEDEKNLEEFQWEGLFSWQLLDKVEVCTSKSNVLLSIFFLSVNICMRKPPGFLKLHPNYKQKICRLS